MRKYGLMLIFGLALAVVGCAHKKMMLNSGQEKLDLSGKSIGLLSVRITNEYKSDYQPWVTAVNIGPPGESPVPAYAHYADDACGRESDDHRWDYYLSLGLLPGVKIVLV